MIGYKKETNTSLANKCIDFDLQTFELLSNSALNQTTLNQTTLNQTQQIYANNIKAYNAKHLKWFDIDSLSSDLFEQEHIHLFEKLIAFLN